MRQAGAKPVDISGMIYRLSGADCIALTLIGLMAGVGLMLLVQLGGRMSPPNSGNRFIERVPIHPAPKLLIEARDDRVLYRASSLGVQDRTPLQAAIMADQPRILEAFRAEALDESDGRIKVDVSFARTASAGPLTSLLRIDTIARKGAPLERRFASTLVNELRAGPFDLSDMFMRGKAHESALDTLLCDAVTSLRQIRAGRKAVSDCSVEHDIHFLKGPPVILVQSDRPNRIGGLRFYFEAGRVAPESEGTYIVTLHQSEFRDHVIPAYRGLFGGYPADIGE